MRKHFFSSSGFGLVSKFQPYLISKKKTWCFALTMKKNWKKIFYWYAFARFASEISRSWHSAIRVLKEFMSIFTVLIFVCWHMRLRWWRNWSELYTLSAYASHVKRKYVKELRIVRTACNAFWVSTNRNVFCDAIERNSFQASLCRFS